MEDLGCSLSKRKTDTVFDQDVGTQRVKRVIKTDVIAYLYHI